MNKLITTYLHGFPFVLDDLRFIDDGIRDSIKGTFDSFLDSSYTRDGFLFAKGKPSVINPDYIDESTPDFPDTYCFLDGEIFFIPTTTLNFTGRNNGDAYCITTDFSFDGAGTKVFEDTNTHETYQIRNAKLVLKLEGDYTIGTDVPVLTFDDSLSNRFIYNQENTYFGRIANKLDVMDNAFVNALRTSQITALQSFRTTTEANWLSVPMDTLMRTTNPVFYRCDSSIPNTGSPEWTPIPSGCTLDTTNSFLKIKRMGKTIFLNINLKDLVLDGYPDMHINGLFIDLNNLGLSGFSGGVVQNFIGNLSGNSDLSSASSSNIEVIKSNGNVSYGKNGIFLRLKKGTSKDYAQWNINYYYTQTSYSGTAAKTTMIADNDIYPTSASWDIKGSLIFEIN